jgi:hypothetical protein
MRVYEELANFKERMLAEMESQIPDLPLVAASELRGLDVNIIKKQLERYLGRLSFWEKRVGDLDAEQQSPIREGVSAERSS